jgi:hypothetical protein
MKIERVDMQGIGVSKQKVVCERTEDWETEIDLLNTGYFLGILSVEGAYSPFLECVEIIDAVIFDSTNLSKGYTEFIWDFMVLCIKNPTCEVDSWHQKKYNEPYEIGRVDIHDLREMMVILDSLWRKFISTGTEISYPPSPLL